MEYLLKVSAVIIIFYLIYKVFLQRDTFFESNRSFLLLGLISAFIIPFLVIPIYIEQPSTLITSYSFSNATAVEKIEAPFNILDYLPVVYLAGVLFFFIRFIIQLASLSTLIFKNKSKKQGGFKFVKINTNISPFSFFNWIVYDPNQFSKTELDQIITHEKVHVLQYHSIDILLTQLSCIVLWFNPFVWFYNKDVKQNLEFIADQNAQCKSNCKKSYQTTLLKTSMPSHQMALSNNFYNSLIKKRIVMLHKSKSKKINQFKFAIVIPLLAIFLMSFNTEKVYVPKAKTLKEKVNNNIINKTANIAKDSNRKDLNHIKWQLEKNNLLGGFSGLKRNNKNDIVKLTTKVEKGKSKASYTWYNDGKPIPNNEIGEIKNGHVIAKTVNNHIKKTAKLNNSIPVSTKAKNDTEVILITKNLTDTNLDAIIRKLKKKGITIKFKGIKRNKDGEITAIKINVNSEGSNANYVINSDDPIKPIKISFDENGENLSIGNVLKNQTCVTTYKTEVVEKVDKDAIEMVYVVKEARVIKKQGDKSKKEVVVISTKNKKEDKIVIRGIHSDDGTKPLIIIDGKESKKSLKDLKPDGIKSVTVLKGEQAIKKHGDKGKNGVVEITTKKD